jgi:hypothetical protein
MAKIAQRTVRASVGVATVVGIALVASAWAAGPAGHNSEPTQARGGATWTPGGELPGAPIPVSQLPARAQAALSAAVAISDGINDRGIREVVSGGSFGLGMKLVSARGPGGAACLSFITDSGGARQFSCLETSRADGSVVRFVADAGTTIGVVERVSLVGLARSDVARVGLVTQDGSEHTLPLNRWRGFAYSTDSADAFPASLRTYDISGALIEEVPTLP